MKATIKLVVITLALLGMGMPAIAGTGEKVEASVGADLVSGYIWRGQDLGGVSVQPSLSLGYKGFSLAAWGSVGFEQSDTKELDLTLGYGIGGFSVAVTDYWFDTEKYFQYSAHSTAHVFEATLGYDFGPVALSWNTNFAGADYFKSNGKRSYSTYIEASAPFRLGGLDWAAEVGLTPWEGAYSTGFNVVNIGLKAAKDIRFNDRFSLPVFAKVTVNPNSEGAYFVFGMSF